MVKGFLRKKECRKIVKHASAKLMSPSTVLRRNSDNYRTSTDTRLESWEFEFLRDIDERVANITRVPRDQHEDVQVARFEADQYYALHADAYDPAVHPSWDFIEHGHKNRLLTMLWYLMDVKDGGHTHFPRAMGLTEPEDIHDCKQGLTVAPKLGSAIIFYNLHANGNFDYNARHAGCPPKRKGGKWSANKWIWNKPVPQRNARDAQQRT
uniref:Fe2OG dioxygenase domain-containing protein n=1 Tax=Alexandrium andersonii TaxID=327968 RepID=A0A7S2BG62_9DINO